MIKQTMFKPEDYTWTISKDIEINPNTGKNDVILKILEFGVEYDFESAKEAEEEVESIVKSLMKTRKIQRLELPIPLKLAKEFTGRITLRIAPETHKKLYIESLQTGISLNKMIDQKLSA